MLNHLDLVFRIALYLICLLCYPLYGQENPPSLKVIPQDQVKINRVDASNPSRWRVFLSGLSENGKSFDLLEGFKITLMLGKGIQDRPLSVQDMEVIEEFVGKTALKGYNGKIDVVKKAKDIKQYAVLVVGLHADIPLERIQAWEKEKFLVNALGGLRQDARVAIIFYRDRIDVMVTPDGNRFELIDINELGRCLADIRERIGEDTEQGQKVACGGFFPNRGIAEMALKKLPAPQGLFPRLFGINETEEVMCRAKKKGHVPLDKLRNDKDREIEPFATGSLEAALRLLLINSPHDAIRQVILVSDGLDGYLRYSDLIMGETTKASRMEKDKPDPCGAVSRDISARCQEIVQGCEKAGKKYLPSKETLSDLSLESCAKRLARKIHANENPCELLNACLEVARPSTCKKVGERCEWDGAQGLAPKGKICVLKNDKCEPQPIPRPKGDELLIESDQAGQHVDRRSAEYQAKMLLCAVPTLQTEMFSREKAVRDYIESLISLYRAGDVRIHSIAIPDTDEVGKARLTAVSVRTGGTFRQMLSDSDAKDITRALTTELEREVVIEPGHKLEPFERYGVAIKVSSENGEDVLQSQKLYEFRAGQKVWFFEPLFSKGRSFFIRKLPNGNLWGPIVFWTLVVLGALVALLFIRMIGKILWGLLKKLFGKKVDVKRPSTPKVPKIERPKMPQMKAPKPPPIKK